MIWHLKIKLLNYACIISVRCLSFTNNTNVKISNSNTILTKWKLLNCIEKLFILVESVSCLLLKKTINKE